MARRECGSAHYVAFAILVLVSFWLVCFVLLTMQWHSENAARTVRSAGNAPSVAGDVANRAGANPSSGEHAPEAHILSRSSGRVVATSDVRGNLGPASVVIQPKPGDDWLHDRWQAASDMHGTNIPGGHWIQLDFGSKIVVDSVVLDWETAYADRYILEGSLDPIVQNEIDPAVPKGQRAGKGSNDTGTKVWTLFDGTEPAQEGLRSVSKSGRSPGVTTELPLHIVHTIHPITVRYPIRYLRLHILKSATGWGVSLWQFDVYGFWGTESLEQ